MQQDQIKEADRIQEEVDVDVDYDEHVSSTAATSSNYDDVHTNWHVDSGATEHVTNEPDKLTIK